MLNKKKFQLVCILIGSGFLTIYSLIFLFYYYIGIFCVNPGSIGELVWCTAPAGTIFPLPRESGNLMAITSKYSLIDYLLYIIVISTGFMYVLPLIFGGISLLSTWRIIQMYQNGKKITNNIKQ